MRVLSTFDSGGIGRKPKPGVLPMQLSSSSYLGFSPVNVDAKMNHIAMKKAVKTA